MSKVMTIASSWGWWILATSSSVKVIACSSVDLAFSVHPESWMLCTTFKYAFFDLDDRPVELPPMITLISPSGGRDDFSIFPFNFSSLLSRPTKFLNFPCLIRLSICCFKSKHSYVSCQWSLWKQQYLFLLCLLGSPFIFPSHFKDGSSLIYIRTCSSGIFNGVYCWFRAEGPDFSLSRSFLSSVHPFFGREPYSEWRLGFASILSDLFLFLAMIASSAFIKFWVEWTSSAMDWCSFV